MGENVKATQIFTVVTKKDGEGKSTNKRCRDLFSFSVVSPETSPKEEKKQRFYYFSYKKNTSILNYIEAQPVYTNL